MLTTSQEMKSIKNNFNKMFNSVLQSLDEIEYNMNLSGNFTTVDRRNNTLMRKKFVDYLINGLDFSDALDFTAVEFPISQNIIDNVLKVTYAIFTRKQRVQKIYCAKILKENGFRTGDIAAILKVTPATVRNYYKLLK